MKQKPNYGSHREQGIALPIIMIILVLAALVAIYTTTTSVKEQQVTADQYRSEQAFATAQAGVDHAVKIYNDYVPFDSDGNLLSSGADVNSDPNIFYKGSYTVMFCDIWDDDGDEAKSAELMKDFLADTLACNNFIDPDHPKNTSPTDVDGFHNDERVGILSVGKPDDFSGRRTISVVSAPGFKVGGGPPGPPLTARGSVGVTGNITLINKYTNLTIWLGEDLDFGSAAVETFINDGTLDRDDYPTGTVGDRAFREAMMDETIPPSETEPYKTVSASNNKIGQNSDALTGDTNLANQNLSPDNMFLKVFSDTRIDVREMARTAGQYFTDVDDITTDPILSGLIWLQPTATGTISLGKDVGTIDAPAFMVVELKNPGTDVFKITTGGTEIYGMVFVFGNADLKGSPVIYGSMMITEQVAKGAGSGTIVFDPESLKTSPEGLAGLRGIEPGTWKDWGYVN